MCIVTYNHLSEVLYSFGKSHPDRDHWLPPQPLASSGDVRLALPGVVLGGRQHLDGGVGASELLDQVRKVLHGVLVGVTQIHRLRVVAVHEADQALHQVVHVLEGASLLPVAVNRDVLVLQCLDDEVAHDATVVGVHSRAEGVEDARHPDLHSGLALVGIPDRIKSESTED